MIMPKLVSRVVPETDQTAFIDAQIIFYSVVSTKWKTVFCPVRDRVQKFERPDVHIVPLNAKGFCCFVQEKGGQDVTRLSCGLSPVYPSGGVTQTLICKNIGFVSESTGIW